MRCLVVILALTCVILDVDVAVASSNLSVATDDVDVWMSRRLEIVTNDAFVQAASQLDVSTENVLVRSLPQLEFLKEDVIIRATPQYDRVMQDVDELTSPDLEYVTEDVGQETSQPDWKEDVAVRASPQTTDYETSQQDVSTEDVPVWASPKFDLAREYVEVLPLTQSEFATEVIQGRIESDDLKEDVVVPTLSPWDVTTEDVNQEALQQDVSTEYVVDRASQQNGGMRQGVDFPDVSTEDLVRTSQQSDFIGQGGDFLKPQHLEFRTEDVIQETSYVDNFKEDVNQETSPLDFLPEDVLVQASSQRSFITEDVIQQTSQSEVTTEHVVRAYPRLGVEGVAQKRAAPGQEQVMVRAVPCACAGRTCACCAQIHIEQFGFNQLGCMDLTYDASSSSVVMKVLADSESLFETRLSGSTPPPRFCKPFPQFPDIIFCASADDVHPDGDQIVACTKLEVVAYDVSVVIVNYKCVGIGDNGVFNIRRSEQMNIRRGLDQPEPKPPSEAVVVHLTTPSGATHVATRSGVTEPTPDAEFKLTINGKAFPPDKASVTRKEAGLPMNKARNPINKASDTRNEAGVPINKAKNREKCKHKAEARKHETKAPKSEEGSPRNEVVTQKNEAEASRNRAEALRNEVEDWRNELEAPINEGDAWENIVKGPTNRVIAWKNELRVPKYEAGTLSNYAGVPKIETAALRIDSRTSRNTAGELSNEAEDKEIEAGSQTTETQVQRNEAAGIDDLDLVDEDLKRVQRTREAAHEEV